MALYLADTNIVINHFRGDELATNFLSEENVLISYISKAELIRGVKDKKTLKELLNTVKDFEIDWGSEMIGKASIKIMVDNQLKQGMGIMDSIIAATALVNDYILVTENIRHFRGIEDLQIQTLSEVVK